MVVVKLVYEKCQGGETIYLQCVAQVKRMRPTEEDGTIPVSQKYLCFLDGATGARGPLFGIQ